MLHDDNIPENLLTTAAIGHGANGDDDHIKGGKASSKDAVKDEDGRVFLEVSIHPFVEQIADENGQPFEGEWANPSDSESWDGLGDDLDGYPDAMFRKGWSVSSWARAASDDHINNDCDDDDGTIDVVDDEEFADYETAITRAHELATKYRVEIDHRY